MNKTNVRFSMSARCKDPMANMLCDHLCVNPFSANRQQLSYDGCLEVRVLYCILKLCTVIGTLR